jgi:uncharacterized membrane protein SirB2
VPLQVAYQESAKHPVSVMVIFQLLVAAVLFVYGIKRVIRVFKEFTPTSWMPLLHQLGLSILYAALNRQHYTDRRMHPLIVSLVGFSLAMPVVVIIILLLNVIGLKYGHLLKAPEEDTDLKED